MKPAEICCTPRKNHPARHLPPLALLLVASALAAQQPALEEIVVTAQKREQSLMDVPISVTAVGGEALAANLVTDIYDLQAVVPSLEVNAVDPPSQGTAFALRGLGNSVFNMGFDPAVAAFVDGVYRSRSGLLSASDFLDLERVEVLKGPQGTLFGKNTTAGVIHFISRKPDFEGPSGMVEAGLEEYGRYRIKGSANLVASDSVAFRFAATYAQGDGWLELINSGEEIHDLDRFALKAQALFNVSESLQVHVVADYATLSEVCCTPLRIVNDPLSPLVNSGAAAAAGSGIVDPPDLDALVAESNLPPEYDADDAGISVEATLELGGMTLTSITGWRNFEDTNVKDNDFSGVDALRSNQSLPEVSLVSEELRLAGASGNIDWMVGGFVSRENIELINEFIWGPQITSWPFFAPGLFGNRPGRAFHHTFEQEINSSALFAHVRVALNEQWSLTAGARYSSDEKDGTMVSDHPLTNAFGIFNSLPLAVVYDYDASTDESEPTYTASVDFRPSDNVMLFATYSRGYKSGGISMTRDAAGNAAVLGHPVFGCAPGTTPLFGPLCAGPMFSPTFEPETADHFEAGLKSELLDRRLRLNLAAWNTDFDNLQTQTLRADGAFAVVNIEGARSRGVELESTLVVSENVSVHASLQWLDATFADGLPPLTPGFLPLGGEDIPFSSNFTGSLGLDFERPVSDGWSLFFSGNAYFRDDYYNFTEPVADRVQEGFTLLNARAGVRSESWEFSVWCRNCGDERVTWSNFQIPFDGLVIAPPPGIHGTQWSHVAEPGMAGATASYRF
ncbi:MAG: TonB-dependent receptor [Gammaproteobacteria bacterium]|nr:TonB-dependent receptor [Gammaproteobacteria bacterium]